jgi:hypothetical protein
MLHEIVAHHPLVETPYNKLIFVGSNDHGTPLYRVLGVDRSPCSAPTALKAAFNRYGGVCYYCSTRLKPQAKPATVSIDHIIPVASDGTHLLHNLVLSCKPCNRDKDCLPIAEFNQEKSQRYIAALEKHIADAVRSASYLKQAAKS